MQCKWKNVNGPSCYTRSFMFFVRLFDREQEWGRGSGKGKNSLSTKHGAGHGA